MHCIFVIISLAALCIGASQHLKTPKIVGGSPGYIPYAVSIFHKEGFYVCGGAIISKNVIVTSARCATLFNASELMVRSGSSLAAHGGTFSPVMKTGQHVNFTLHSPDYDVGILVLDGTVDKKSQTIKLAEKEVNDGQKILVSGWGSIVENGPLSNKVNSVLMKKISRDECRSFYSGAYEITSRMICGSYPGKGLCKGDVGGPVVWNNQLVGIVSFGMGCGKPEHPGVFTNVASSEIRNFLADGIKSLEYNTMK